jgi:PAS domain S-box-containing protein
MIRLLHRGQDFLPCAVVMLTGIGNEEIAVEAMKLGIMDYLPKGTASSQALSMTVASAVQRFRLRQELAAQRSALEQRNRELEAIRAELFEEKERYRILAEAIPQLVWTADSDGRVHYGNQRLREFNGHAGATGWRLEDLVHADDREGLLRKWTAAAQSGDAFESELRLQRAQDQTWRWQLMRTAPIRTADGGPVSWFGTFTDIEDQKRAEEAMRQRQKLDSIASLAGGVAHDFNNLLVGIMGGASFAIDTIDEDHSAYPMLQLIMRSSERAAHLTKQLLAYAGRVNVKLEPADLSEIVRQSCEQLKASIPANVQLVMETATDLPRIETNPGQVREVIDNLLMNAFEAIGDQPGIVKVTTANRHISPGEPQSNVLGYELSAGDYILVEVTDSGQGMDEQMQSQIFDPFFTTKFTGRGLGLSAVQGIVRTLGGAISVTSSAGRGSSFRVLLPAADVAMIPVVGRGEAGGRQDEEAAR